MNDISKYSKFASYLLEDNQELNEAVSNELLNILKKNAPDMVNPIKQLKNNQDLIQKELMDYTKTVIGVASKNQKEALDIISKHPKSEATSITEILTKAANIKDETVKKMTFIQRKKELEKFARTKGIDSKGKTPKDLITSLTQKAATPTQSPQTSGATTSASPEGRDTNEPVKYYEPFPGKRDLFIAAYNKTISLGWPGEPVKVKGDSDKDGKKIEQDVTGKKIPFNVGAKVGTKIFDAIPSAKVDTRWIKLAKQLVYDKFKNNINGLKKLSDYVDEVNDKNKNYKTSRRVNFRSALLNIGNSFLERFGAAESDKAIFNWLVKRAVGMDIFEFQKMIIDDVKSSLDLSDDRIAKMEKLASGVKKMLEGNSQAPRFLISPIKSNQGWDYYEVSYGIKPASKPNNTPAKMAEPMMFFLNQMSTYNKSSSSKTWTEIPSNEDIQNELVKLKDYINDPKKNPYEYAQGEDGPLSYVETETVGDKVTGTQYMYPTYLGKDGMRVIIKYKPESKE